LVASIEHPLLQVSTNPFQNQATVIASCDVEFSDFEVNAMNVLGLRYTVECRVLNKDLQYEDTVLRYNRQDLPRDTQRARHSEHIVFETGAVMSDLHEHVFTRDQLVAEFTLTDHETEAAQVRRSAVLTVDLEG
jgi:hypothetical protein